MKKKKKKEKIEIKIKTQKSKKIQNPEGEGEQEQTQKIINAKRTDLRLPLLLNFEFSQQIYLFIIRRWPHFPSFQ